MPRNMSFSLTTEQIRNRTKTVTRRRGWRFLKAGDIVNACVKCQGLKPGEKIEKICQLRIKDVRREPLIDIDDYDHFGGHTETAKEGFPLLSGEAFAEMFCEHMGGDIDQEVTRIEFDYPFPQEKTMSENGQATGTPEAPEHDAATQRELDHLAEIRRVNDRVTVLAGEEAEAREEHKAAKKALESAQADLCKLIRRGPDPQGKLFSDKEEPAEPDDAWRDVPIAEALGLTAKELETFEEVGVTTMGQFEDYRAEPGLESLKGVGKAKAQKFEDRALDWLSENRDKAVLEAAAAGGEEAEKPSVIRIVALSPGLEAEGIEIGDPFDVVEWHGDKPCIESDKGNPIMLEADEWDAGPTESAEEVAEPAGAA